MLKRREKNRGKNWLGKKKKKKKLTVQKVFSKGWKIIVEIIGLEKKKKIISLTFIDVIFLPLYLRLVTSTG